MPASPRLQEKSDTLAVGKSPSSQLFDVWTLPAYYTNCLIVGFPRDRYADMLSDSAQAGAGSDRVLSPRHINLGDEDVLLSCRHPRCQGTKNQTQQDKKDPL